MYKELTIENIKIFTKEQKLKIAPITLIYGENSTGKTTLLKTFDIVHNIFSPRSILAGKSTTGQDTEDMLVKNDKEKKQDLKKRETKKKQNNVIDFIDYLKKLREK